MAQRKCGESSIFFQMAANDVENKKEHGEERSTAAAHYTVPLFITDILTGRFALTKQMVLGKIN